MEEGTVTVLRTLSVFLAAAVGDLTWTRWTLCCNRHRSLEAAAWGVGIVVLGATWVTAYVDNFWYVVPAALGAGLGTYLTVRFTGQ